MRVILSADEVLVARGEYTDEDDCLCRGCGAELKAWGSHNVRDCLRTLRYKIDELEETIKNMKKGSNTDGT